MRPILAPRWRATFFCNFWRKYVAGWFSHSSRIRWQYLTRRVRRGPALRVGPIPRDTRNQLGKRGNNTLPTRIQKNGNFRWKPQFCEKNANAKYQRTFRFEQLHNRTPNWADRARKKTAIYTGAQLAIRGGGEIQWNWWGLPEENAKNVEILFIS